MPKYMPKYMPTLACVNFRVCVVTEHVTVKLLK